ncbi:MAG: hypothetical protein SVN78_06360 [Deferribacterota bacterium]|nr:hypothetical protein [Deferribacterota bacterium]
MIRYFFFLLFFILLISTSYGEIDENFEVSLEADSITYVLENIVKAEGNVFIYYKDMLLTADKVIYNRKTNDVEAEGHVIINDKESYITADRISINLDKMTGIIENGSGYYYPDKYFKASKIKRLNENNYILDNATITGCENKPPDWSFSAKRVNIEYGEIFTAKNVKAKIKDVPVLYLPYFAWPIKVKRESGFLIPKVGTSSELGFIFGPKYFANIDVDKDATLGANIFTSKGVQPLGEFRYAKSESEKVYIAGEFLHDFDTEADKEERWKLTNISNFYIFDNLELRFNQNYVSDYRYRRDFDDYSINKLDEFGENRFINEVRLNYYTKYADFTLRYRDDMHFFDLENGFIKERQVRKPNILVEKNYINLGLVNLDYKFEYDNVETENDIYDIDVRDDEDISKDFQRIHGYLTLYKPVNLGFGTLTPSYKQYYTRWDTPSFGYGRVRDDKDHDLAQLSVDNNDIERTIYNYSVKLKLNDIYKNYEDFSHHIYNTFEYTRTPHLEQDELIRALEDDVIDEEDAFLYTLTNYFKTSAWNLRLDLISGVDFRENDRAHPFHEKINFTYKRYLNYQNEVKVDYYGEGITYFDNRLNLNFENFYISLRQLYDEELLELSENYILLNNYNMSINDLFTNSIISSENAQLDLRVGFNIKRVNIEFSMEASDKVEDFSEDIVTSLDINRFSVKTSYKSDCWEVGIMYKNDRYDEIEYDHIDDDTDHSVILFISLKGLGSGEQKIM